MAMRALFLTATCLSMLGATRVAAQTAPGGQVEAPPSGTQQAAVPDTTKGVDSTGSDIVVTAQRRSESAQRVPISLTAVSAAQIERAAITNVQDLPRVAPGFTAYRAPQAANTFLAIRGIGSSGNAAIEPSVGAFVDGIYIARPGPLLAAINDVSSIEVLRGPQGTLFGRNASVGAISIHTTEPTNAFEGQGSVEYGSYNRLRLNGIVNTPITQDVATRFSVLYDRNDGYGRNDLIGGARFGGNETLSFRGALRAKITPSLTWLLRGDYQQQNGDGQPIVTVDAATVTPTAAANFRSTLNGLVPRLDGTYNYTVNQLTDGRLNDKQWGVASDLSLAAGGFTVRLLSGYRNWNNHQTERDLTLTAADLFGRAANYRSETHSEELQLLSPPDLFGRLSFVAGLYYYRENYSIGTDFNLGAGYCSIYLRNTRPAGVAGCLAGPQQRAAVTAFGQITESYAGFGQATLKLTDKWDITGGLRYSHDAKDGSILAVLNNPGFSGVVAPDSATLAFDGGKLTYRANTTWRPLDGIMLYATVSSGYKSGGFDSGSGATLGTARVFKPETTTNYEVGFKTQTFNRKLTVNATLFRMDVDQFQLRAYNGTSFSVRNAGSIRQQGLEFEVDARPVRNLTLSAAATRLASRYTDFQDAPGLPGFGGTQNLTGARLPFSPKWQGNIAADYRTPAIASGWSLGLNTRLAFVSDIDVGAGGDGNPQGIQPGYALLGARLTLYAPSDRVEIALSGENLTDKGYCTVKFSQTLARGLGLNDATTGGTVQRCVLGEPRVFRLSGKVRF